MCTLENGGGRRGRGAVQQGSLCGQTRREWRKEASTMGARVQVHKREATQRNTKRRGGYRIVGKGQQGRHPGGNAVHAGGHDMPGSTENGAEVGWEVAGQGSCLSLGRREGGARPAARSTTTSAPCVGPGTTPCPYPARCSMLSRWRRAQKKHCSMGSPSFPAADAVSTMVCTSSSLSCRLSALSMYQSFMPSAPGGRSLRNHAC